MRPNTHIKQSAFILCLAIILAGCSGGGSTTETTILETNTSKPALITNESTSLIVESSIVEQDIKETSTVITWDLNDNATGQVEYGTDENYGQLSMKIDDFETNTHTIALSDLQADTLYNYRIISEDISGNKVVSKNKTFRTRGKSPFVESTPESVPAPAPEPIVEPTPTLVPSPVPEPIVEPAPTPVTAPAPEPIVEQTPTPVTAPAPEPIVEQTPTPVPAPAPEPIVVPELIILSVSNKDTQTNSTFIEWMLNANATGQIEYGETTDYGNYNIKETSFNYDSHTQQINNLKEDTVYHYRVISEDENGNKVVSQDYTFKTLPADLKTTTEPVITTVTEAIPEPVPAPAPIVEPTSDPVPEPAPEQIVEPIVEPTLEPVPAPTPIVAPTQEPIVELTPEPIVEPTPEPVPAPAPEPIVAPTPEPIVEPTPEPILVPELIILSVSNKDTQTNSTFIEWMLNANATGQIEYGETTDYGNYNIKETSFNYDSHTQQINNLKEDTVYHYRVISEDENGNKVVSQDYTFKTLPADLKTTTEPVITTVTEAIPEPVPAPAPIVEPTSDPVPEPAPEQIVEPIVEPTLEPVPAPAPIVEPTPEPVAEPAPEPIVEPAPVPELIILSVINKDTQTNSTLIEWVLNTNATGQVEYGITSDYGDFSVEEDSFKYNKHIQTLSNLQSDTTYHYRVISEDENGNKVVSQDYTFKTLPADLQPTTEPIVEQVPTPVAEPIVAPLSTADSIAIPEGQNAYYVSVFGNNNNNGQTEATAWRTIAYAASKAKAGDSVYIKAGKYTNENIIVANSGTVDKPIVFEGYKSTLNDNPTLNWSYSNTSLSLGLDPTIMPLIDGENRAVGRAIYIRDKSNIIFKNMQITNYSEGVMIYGTGATQNQMDNIISENFGDVNAEYAGLGITITQGAHNNTIKNSVVLNSGAQAITINGNGNILNNCKAYGNDNSTGIKSATDYYIIISGNDNQILNSYAERKAYLAHRGHGFNIKSNGERNLIKNCTTKNISGSFVFRHSGVKNNTFEDITALGTGDTNTFGLTFRDGASDNTVIRYHANGIAHAVTFRESTEDGANTYSGLNNTIIDSTFENIISSFVIYFAPTSTGTGISSGNVFKNITLDGASTSASLFYSSNKSQDNIFEDSTFKDIEKYSTGIQESAIFINAITQNLGFTLP